MPRDDFGYESDCGSEPSSRSSDDSTSSDETITQEVYLKAASSRRSESGREFLYFASHFLINSLSPVDHTMETAIRWSPRSTNYDARFLIADVIGRTFRLCSVTSYKDHCLRWEELSRNTKVPPFRAFDWSSLNNVVAVGQWSGETTVLGLENGSQALSLPIKSQRQCNAIAFNPETLLATGLERARNDFCLNVYDINEWSIARSIKSVEKQTTAEPVRKLANSEGITSIKFFIEQPNMLVAGVKGTCIRVYDLRDNTGNPVLQHQTTCVHNIAIDPSDQNYFASAGPPRDPTVLLWDRRSALRPSATRAATSSSSSQDGAILELKDVFNGEDKFESASIWSLRFSSTACGSLGILNSNGQLRVFQTKKDYVGQDESISNEPAADASSSRYVQPITLRRTHFVEHSYQYRPQGSELPEREEIDRIVSFDFLDVLSPSPGSQSCAIILRGNQDIEIKELRGTPPVLGVSILSSIAISDSGHEEVDPKLNLRIYKPPVEGSISNALLSLNNVIGFKRRGRKFANSKVQADPEDVSQLPNARVEAYLTLSDVARRRASEGYLLNPSQNVEIVRGEENLEGLWSWLALCRRNAADGRMVSNHLDFSFLGLDGIWNEDLGRMRNARLLSKEPLQGTVRDAMERLVQSLDLKSFKIPGTEKAAHRKLMFHTLGFSPHSSAIKEEVQRLAQEGRETEAALLALIFQGTRQAFGALRLGPNRPNYRALGIFVSAYASGSTNTDDQAEVDEVLAGSDDPFYQAIVAYCRKGLWEDVVSAVRSLDIRYTSAIAIKCLDDPELGQLIQVMTEDAMEGGYVDGIVYTGLGDKALHLFAAYIDVTKDLQTVVLAMSFTFPKFTRDPLFDSWRESYRMQLNAWRLWLVRAMFDQHSILLATTWDGVKLIKPPPRSISIRCSNCERPFPRELQAQAKKSTFGSATSIFDANSGFKCPKCQTHLPRCVVCEHWLGKGGPSLEDLTLSDQMKVQVAEEKARSADAGVAEGTESKGKEKETAPKEDNFQHHLEICLTCNHMYHRGHISKWFSEYDVCPAVGCQCRCTNVDPMKHHG